MFPPQKEDLDHIWWKVGNWAQTKQKSSVKETSWHWRCTRVWVMICNLAILTPHNVTIADIPNYRIHFIPQSVKMVNIPMTPEFEFSNKCRIKSEQIHWVNNLTDWPFHLTLDSSLWSPPFNTRHDVGFPFQMKLQLTWAKQGIIYQCESNSFAFQLLATELFIGGANSQSLAGKKNPGQCFHNFWK